MSMISYFAKFVKMLRSRLPWAVLRGPLGGRDPQPPVEPVLSDATRSDRCAQKIAALRGDAATREAFGEALAFDDLRLIGTLIGVTRG